MEIAPDFNFILFLIVSAVFLFAALVPTGNGGLALGQDAAGGG